MTTHDLAGAQRELSQLGADAVTELEAAQRQQLELLAAQGAAGAAGAGGAAVYVGPTIRADGLELVAGDGSPTSGGGTAADVLWGTMMGSALYRQFPPPAGDGYYLWADLEALERGDDPWRQLELDGLDRALAGVG